MQTCALEMNPLCVTLTMGSNPTMLTTPNPNNHRINALDFNESKFIGLSNLCEIC
jgi:hypothetical protein